MLSSVIAKLADLTPHFLGIFAADMFPPIQANTSFIVNTQPSSENGEHWLAIFIDETTIHLFDSFGRDFEGFTEPFNTFLDEFSRGYKTFAERRLVQDFGSNTCGEWSLYYIFNKTCQKDNCLKYFGGDLERNELFLKYFFEWIND